MKFPQAIRHRRIEAKIYGKSRDYPFYRLSYYVAGQRQMRHFATYSGAKSEAERIVRELASGSRAAVSAAQFCDALAALEPLEAFRQFTGKRFSLLGAVSGFVEAASKLNGGTLGETVEGSMRAMLALGGLAGLRTAELPRLDWADVWRVPGHTRTCASD